MKSKEEWKTYKNVFDNYTLRNLFKLSTKHFDELQSTIALGKEANVFSATTKEGKIIVKIYRLNACDFNNMYNYIKYDPRFQDLKNQKRKVIFAWTQREYQNLLKAREAGIRVPKPLQFLDNIILLEFIGDESPAPMLKDAKPDNPEEFFEKIINNMKTLYKKAGLVHADLSGFNILNHNENPVMIDFSQSTQLNNPNAKEYLKRDIKNICTLFKKWKIESNQDQIFKDIIK